MRKRFFFPKRDSDGRNGLLSFFFSLFLFNEFRVIQGTPFLVL